VNTILGNDIAKFITRINIRIVAFDNSILVNLEPKISSEFMANIVPAITAANPIIEKITKNIPFKVAILSLSS